MPTLLTVITTGLMLAGIAGMGISIWRTRRIFTLLQDASDSRIWHLLQQMMAFFFIGYFASLLLFLAHFDGWLAMLTGLLYFSGSLFVYLVVHNGNLTIDKIRREVESVANANVVAAELMADLEEANESLNLTTVQLREAKEAAEAAEAIKSRFLANISHELRTPLNGILGYTQILQRNSEILAVAQARKGLEVIERSGVHLLSLINDILDLSKIEADKMELLPDEFSPREMLAGVVELIQVQARQKGLRVRQSIPEELPDCLYGDAKRLSQVLLNILNNAVKYTSNGEIRLSLSCHPLAADQGQGSMIHLGFAVEDTGIGISESQLERIFVPFEQVRDLSRSQEGTGLGLAISRKLVQMMGGDLEASSVPGQGSRFAFDVVLPQVLEPRPQVAEARVLQVTGYKGPRRRILVVDDIANNRSLLVDLLEPLGFELREAVNGREAVDIALEFQPDLVFMDLVMPVMDGFAATQVIRQSPIAPQPVIMAISASLSQIPRETFGQHGLDDFILKPMRLSHLLTVLSQHLQLEWIMPEPAPDSQTSKAPEPATAGAPGPEQLRLLYALAEEGNFIELQDRLKELEDEDSRLAGFVAQVRTLAEDYEDEAICRLLSGCMELAP
ncbi:MAG: ATP-binding protein [Candidatus Sericytochromatia bacterium]